MIFQTRKLHFSIIWLITIALISFDVSAKKGRRPLPSLESTTEGYIDGVATTDFESTHKPSINIDYGDDGLVRIVVTTPLESSSSHRITRHSILDSDKTMLIKSRFNSLEHKLTSSNYTFRHSPGKYYVESVCNKHGRWLEPFEITD